VNDFSEQDGSFRSDNLLSNEVWLQYVIPDLVKTAKTNRVYMGWDQNRISRIWRR